ncbi:MAG: TonB-dependent receptor [Gemmatimonadota bacterium]|jgi:iron complex outermembrane receptor protein
MKPSIVRFWPVLAAAVLVPLASAPVAAQDAEADQDSVPRFNIQGVIVEVMKTPIEVGASPYPVSVAGAAELREGKNGMFLEDALETLPGVQVQNRFNYAVGERVSIRGFGSRAQFGVRGIHVEVDGIPATLPDGQSTLDHVDIGSLGRVEALRGPASALYGNSSGGVLRFETEVPSRSSVREEATTVFGSDGLVRLQSVTGGTVGTTGYLVSVDNLDYQGFRHYDGEPNNPYGKADRFHLVGRLEQEMAGGELGITLNYLDLYAENPGSLPLSRYEDDETQVFPFAYTNFQTRKAVQQSQLGATWDGPVAGLDLQAAAYGVTRDFNNPLPGDVVDVDRRAGGARVLLGKASTSGDVVIDVRGGLETDFQDDDRREYNNVQGTPGSLTLNQTEQVRSAAGFLQTTLTYGDRLTFMGGLRYDHTHFEVSDLFPVTPVNADDSGSRDMNKLSPSVGVHVQAVPEIGFFANYATSFETPTTVELGNRENGAGGFNPNLDPMSGHTIEVGARGAVGSMLSYEASYFHTKLEDELIAFENSSLLTYYRNAGSSTRDGFEVVARVRPHDLVSVQGSVNYVDATFDEYSVGGNDYAGNKVPGLAPTQVQGSIRLGPDLWFLEFGAEYSAEAEVNDANDATPADAYTLFDIRAGANGYRAGRFEISPFAGVQNLGNKKYVSSIAINAFGARYYEPGPRRTFYVGATVAVAR